MGQNALLNVFELVVQIYLSLMLINFSSIFNKIKKSIDNKVFHTLFYKKQFNYLKRTHSYQFS